jgi:mono/diheme cytochrome c family protein
VVDRVLNGFIDHGMPAWRNVLSDDQISAVLTFVRNSWGNEFGAVLAEEVAAAR